MTLSDTAPTPTVSGTFEKGVCGAHAMSRPSDPNAVSCKCRQ